MGKNTGKGYRKGVIVERTQVYNDKTKQYVKRDAKTGRFMSSKSTPFKNIRKEMSSKENKVSLKDKKEDNKKKGDK
jgi:ribosomal protein L24E